MTVAPWIVSDALRERVQPLLPVVERRFRYPGRKRLDDRAALQGILFVLHTEASCLGGRVTCRHRRLGLHPSAARKRSYE